MVVGHIVELLQNRNCFSGQALGVLTGLSKDVSKCRCWHPEDLFADGFQRVKGILASIASSLRPIIEGSHALAKRGEGTRKSGLT